MFIKYKNSPYNKLKFSEIFTYTISFFPKGRMPSGPAKGPRGRPKGLVRKSCMCVRYKVEFFESVCLCGSVETLKNREKPLF